MCHQSTTPLFKYYLLGTLTILCNLILSAQTGVSSSNSFNGVNLSASFHTNGGLFWDGNKGNFQVPRNQGKNTISAGALWIGGEDTLKKIHLSAHTYGLTGSDFQSGPLNSSGKSDSATYKNYRRFFNISKLEVDSFILGVLKNKSNILNWPGNLDLASKTPRKFAPFVDVDNNGLYEPSKGDYPNFKGDNATFWVYNDDVTHNESGGNSLGVEIQALAFSFNCSTDPILSNTIFVDYTISNKSSMDYSDVYVGLWTDFDIGNPKNDYVGCSVANQAVYGYNAVDSDKDTFGILNSNDTVKFKGYGTQIPTQSVQFFNGLLLPNSKYQPMSSMIYILNEQTFGVQSKPRYDVHYYNYLKGLWLNGDSITANGTGWNKNKPPYSHFCFDGSPLNKNSWSEKSANNSIADRSTISSFGPFNLKSGESVQLTSAYSTHFPSLGQKKEGGIFKMFQNTASLDNLYKKGVLFGCDGLNTCSSNGCVYPGDANDDGKVDATDLFYIGYAYGQTGTPRTFKGNAFKGQNATDWTKTFPTSENFKYADCNGDGTIDSADVEAIAINYRLVHKKTDGLNKKSNYGRVYAVVVEDSLSPGKTYTMYIKYEPGTDTSLSKIFGISFDLETFGYPIDSDQISIITDGGLFGLGKKIRYIGFDPITKKRTITISMANGKSARADTGTIATVKYVISDNISGGLKPFTVFSTSNVIGVDEKLNAYGLTSGTDSVGIRNGIFIPSQNNIKVLMYPNPSKSILNVYVQESRVNYVLLDLTGKQLRTGQLIGYQNQQINLEGLVNGFYVLRINNGNKQSTMPFIKNE